VAKFKVLSRHLPGGTEENHKNVGQDSRSRSLGPSKNEVTAIFSEMCCTVNLTTVEEKQSCPHASQS
jgi:hypothetical protein